MLGDVGVFPSQSDGVECDAIGGIGESMAYRTIERARFRHGETVADDATGPDYQGEAVHL